MSEDTSAKSLSDTSAGFWIWVLIVTIGIPALFLVAYEYLAGGILSGLWGSWRQPVVNPDIFLLGINPIIMLGAYGFLSVHFRKYVKMHKNNYIKVILASFVMVLATFIAATVVLWKAITT